MEPVIGIPAGEVAPGFTLPGAKGRDVGIWDYKQRENVVVFFFDPHLEASRNALAAFAENYFRYRSLQAEILGIANASLATLKQIAAELSLPFDLLSDEGGKVAARYGVAAPGRTTTPMVFALDRYNAVERVWRLAADELPDQEDILATVELSQSRCPE